MVRNARDLPSRAGCRGYTERKRHRELHPEETLPGSKEQRQEDSCPGHTQSDFRIHHAFRDASTEGQHGDSVSPVHGEQALRHENHCPRLPDAPLHCRHRRLRRHSAILPARGTESCQGNPRPSNSRSPGRSRRYLPESEGRP